MSLIFPIRRHLLPIYSWPHFLYTSSFTLPSHLSLSLPSGLSLVSIIFFMNSEKLLLFSFFPILSEIITIMKSYVHYTQITSYTHKLYRKIGTAWISRDNRDLLYATVVNAFRADRVTRATRFRGKKPVDVRYKLLHHESRLWYTVTKNYT